MNMNCTIFRENLDAYIDSELDRKTRRAMEEHAASCPECGALLNQAMDIITRCAELNEGLTVPLECQAAWRKAVREEAGAKEKAQEKRRSARRSGRNAWVRALSAVAAVVVLLVAVGTQLGPDGFSDLLPARESGMRSVSGGMMYDNYYDRGVAYETADYDAAPMMYAESAAAMGGTSPGVVLQSDGAIDQTAAVSDTSQKDTPGVIVLRSATRSIITKEFDADTLFLDDLVAEYNAYFESRRVTGNAEDANRLLKASIRVPSESLDDFLTALDVRGTVTLREESAEDITANYNDVAARLEVLRSQLEQLNAMNAKARSVSDLIEINERANEVTADIEAYESRIRDWNSRRSYSTVTLTLNELGEKEPLPVKKTLSERMKEAFDNSIEWLKEFGQDAAVFGAALLPRLVIWVPVIIIVIVLLRVAFGRRGKKNK